MLKLMQELVVVAGVLMGVPEADVVRMGTPTITTHSPCDVAKIYEGQLGIDTPCPAITGDVEAVYLGGHIYLASDIDLSTLYGQSILTHELAHFVQDRLGQHVPGMSRCDIAEQEKQAYEVQILVVRLVRGVDREQAMMLLGMDPVSLAVVTSCNPVYERRN